MKNSQYRNSRIWETKDIMINVQKPRQESGLCDHSFARYSEKYFTQIYKALYEDARLVSFLGGTNMAAGNQQNICFCIFLLMREFIAWEKQYLVQDNECLDRKISKN